MNNKGFTLVEVLIVIAIIGVIMVMVFPSINNLLNSNKEELCNYYKDVLVERAKMMVDRNEDDLLSSGSYTFTYNEIVKEYPLADNKNLDCSSNTLVKVVKNNNKFNYEVTLYCIEKESNKVVCSN